MKQLIRESCAKNVQNSTMGKVLSPNLSLLVVSYYFPPNSEVGGRRVARFCEYLPNHGIDPTVLTIDEASCGSIDLSFRPSEKLPIVRVRPSKTILDWYHKQLSTPEGADAVLPESRTKKPGSGGMSLKRHVRFLFEIPDYCRGWYRPAVKRASKIVLDSGIDAVFSSGPPSTTHAVAYAISRRYHLPWVADFRDVWAADPWRRYALNSGIPKWRDWIDLRIETKWTRHAALITCTTRQQRDFLLRIHPHLDADRVAVVSNGVDSFTPTISTANGTKNGPRVLLNAGSLYGGRKIDAFCNATSFLVEQNRISSRDVRIIFIGEVDPIIKSAAIQSAPELFENGMISFQPRTDWAKLQEMLWRADVLLLFQGDHRTAVPAKFFEYLKTGKPMLALAGDGALSDIVRDTASGLVAAPDNSTEIASAILHVLDAKPRTNKEAEEITKKFDFRNLTAELAANIHRVLT